MTKINLYMPAYEAKKEHIQAAVESVLAQTEQDWTLHIQDDCSQHENVHEHIAQYKTDARISYERNEKNMGIGPNWNACLQHGTAPYLAYLFHDDVWNPEYVQSALEVLENTPEAGFVSLGHSYLQEDNVQDTSIYDEVEAFVQQHIHAGTHDGIELLLWWAEHGLRPNIIGEPSFVVLRRALVEKVGMFHETMPQFLDSEYWIRCLLQTDWWYAPGNFGSFRVHSAAASAQNAQAGYGAFDRFDCFQMLITKLPPEKKRQAKQAFTRAFDGMVAKFFERKKAGRTVSTKGSNGMKKFAIKHPLLVCKALWKNFLQ